MASRMQSRCRAGAGRGAPSQQRPGCRSIRASSAAGWQQPGPGGGQLHRQRQPSSRRLSSATAAALVGDSSKRASAAWARTTNSWTAGIAAKLATVQDGALGAGHRQGPHLDHLLPPQSQRLAARGQDREVGARRQQRVEVRRGGAAGAPGCPPPARPTAPRGTPSAPRADPAPGCSRTPTTRAIVGTTRAGSASGARSTNQTPSGKRSAPAPRRRWPGASCRPRRGRSTSAGGRPPGRGGCGGRPARPPARSAASAAAGDGRGRGTWRGSASHPLPGRAAAGDDRSKPIRWAHGRARPLSGSGGNGVTARSALHNAGSVHNADNVKDTGRSGCS